MTAVGRYANEVSIEGHQGTGTKTSNSVTANVFIGGGGAVQVSVGGAHTCAVLSSGHIDCWGRNHDGELGDGTTTKSGTPVEVEEISDATEVTAAEERNTCALLASGHIDCWGKDEFGQLANGELNERPNETPVEVHGISNATDVDASGTNSCAVLSTGHVECWAENREGQVGNGEFGSELEGESPPWWEVPAEVPDISDGTQVGRGDAWFACALRSGGGVDCSGNGEHGQLGNGKFKRQDTPVEVQGISTGTKLSAGVDDACALLAGGQIDCWGGGQSTPVEVQGISNATQVSAGGSDTCAVLPSHQIDCWGENQYGQLGDGTTTNSETPVEVQGT